MPLIVEQFKAATNIIYRRRIPSAQYLNHKGSSDWLNSIGVQSTFLTCDLRHIANSIMYLSQAYRKKPQPKSLREIRTKIWDDFINCYLVVFDDMYML